MAYKTITSTHNRFVGLFSSTTDLTAGSAIFGGLTADPSSFQFTKGFVDSGASATVGFGAAGITFTLPAGFNSFDEHGMAVSSTSCDKVSVSVSSGFAILEFKGVPTTRPVNYFS